MIRFTSTASHPSRNRLACVLPALAAFAATCASALPQVALAQRFDCVLVPPQSNLSATVTFSSRLTGTLIGTYTAADLLGSRTKPGLFTSFGATENVVIPISIAAGVGNTVVTSSVTGAFELSIDLAGLTASIAGYSTSLFTAAPVVIPVTANITIPSFRTRTPTSTYFAATVPVPLGNATIRLLRADQDGAALGTLSQVSATEYDVTIPLALLYTIEGDVAGTPIDNVATTPTPGIFTARVKLTASGIEVRSSGAVTFSDIQTPNTVVPEFSFDLPTILPPGLVVPVLMNLVLTNSEVSLNGTQTFLALGRPFCFADFNQDGGIDGADVDAFFAVWITGAAEADVNQDGGVDGADVDLFFTLWSNGGC